MRWTRPWQCTVRLPSQLVFSSGYQFAEMDGQQLKKSVLIARRFHPPLERYQPVDDSEGRAGRNDVIGSSCSSNSGSSSNNSGRVNSRRSRSRTRNRSRSRFVSRHRFPTLTATDSDLPGRLYVGNVAFGTKLKVEKAQLACSANCHSVQEVQDEFSTVGPLLDVSYIQLPVPTIFLQYSTVRCRVLLCEHVLWMSSKMRTIARFRSTTERCVL